MLDYYEKPQERFAELFGIFLTQPKSVAEQAPKTYATLVKAVAQNEKFARAYERISSLKWEGKAADAFMEKVEETWSEEAQELQRLSIRYVVNGWKQYHADPKAKQYKQMRAIKDPKLKAKAMEWIDGGAKWQD